MKRFLARDCPGLQRRARSCSGQALLEFVFISLMMIALLFGLIDFGRAIYQRQVMTALTREGSNLASRGTTLSNTVDAVINSASPLDINTKGRVIVSAVYNSNGTFRVTKQVSKGGVSATSKVRNGVGSPAVMPATAVAIPQPNQTAYVTEIYYSYAPITPIGKLLNFTLPTQLYDVAYF